MVVQDATTLKTPKCAMQNKNHPRTFKCIIKQVRSPFYGFTKYEIIRFIPLQYLHAFNNIIMCSKR